MNNNSAIRLVLPFILALGCLFLVVDLLTSGGNAVAQIYRYCFFGAAVFGLLSPKNGFYVLIFLTAYLDFFKRLMILDSGVSMYDLYLVLGIAPALLSGMGCSVLYSLMTGSKQGNGKLLKLAICVLGACAVLAAAAIGVAKGLKEMADVINGIIYLPLIFIVPAMFRSPGEIRNMFRILIYIYIPAILYMLVHYVRATFFHMNPPIFGWELDYLKSGLTIEIRQLNELVFRPFGTFNSASNASMVFAILFTFLSAGWWSLPPRNQSAMTPLRLVLMPLVLISMLATYSRTGWVLLLAMLVAMVLFKRRTPTIIFYSMSLITFLITAFASPYLIKTNALNIWSSMILSEVGAGNKMIQATSIGTMQDRLVGFAALVTDGRVWTPFGFTFAYANPRDAMARISAHDVITLGLMKFGYVPIALVGLMGARMLRALHRFLYQERDPLIKSLAATSLSVSIALLLGGTVNFGQLITFPVNFWIWLMFGCMASLMRFQKDEVSEESAAIRTILPGPLHAKRNRLLPVISARDRN